MNIKKLIAKYLFPVKDGKEQREGWSEPIQMYLFYCPECKTYQRDYKSGFYPNQYLTCEKCKTKLRV